MAQRHEIEAWVNPGARDDPEDAQAVIDTIMDTGSDDEAVWAGIAFPEDGQPQGEAVLAAAARDYDRAAEHMDSAREVLFSAIRRSRGAGMSAAGIATAVGMSRQRVTEIVRDS